MEKKIAPAKTKLGILIAVPGTVPPSFTAAVGIIRKGLAKPGVLPLGLFADLAERAGLGRILQWLGFCFKLPQTLPVLRTEHYIAKLIKLANIPRFFMGKDLITHLGFSYYEEELATV